MPSSARADDPDLVRNHAKSVGHAGRPVKKLGGPTWYYGFVGLTWDTDREAFDELRRVALEARQARQVATDRLEVRNQLAVDLVDRGHPLDRVASAALISPKRLLQVLGRPD